MRWRDAIKSAAQCEREGIGDPGKDSKADDIFVKDGGDGKRINSYMRETRRRLNRLEDRLALQIKLQFLILGAIVSGIGVGLVLAFVFG